MSARRTIARSALVTATVAAAIATAAALGPRVLTAVGQLRATDRDPAAIASVVSLEPRWVEPVTGWPSAIAADGRGAVVLAGRGEVRALDRDGSTRWRVEVPGVALHPPALARSTVLLGAATRVVALDRGTGATRWEATVSEGDAGPVALVDGYALAGTEAGALVAFDTSTGEQRWSSRYPGAIRTPPVHDDRNPGVVAAAWHGGDDPRLRGLDLVTGAMVWDAPLLGFATAPVATAGLVVVGDGDGEYRARIVARSIRDGTEAWSTPAPASFESGITPGAAGDDVAVVDHFGTVTILDAATGAVRARTELDEPVLHTAVLLSRELVALTTHQGAVTLIDRSSGRLRYRGSLGGYPAAIARSGPDLLVALRLQEPGRIESIPLPLH